MILIGDCLQRLQELPDESIQCCITSPPYWGLRDYGVAGQMGVEKTPEELVIKLTEVFREVRRVLKDDGTLWLNLGDSYAATSYGSGGGWAKGKSKDGSGGNSQERSLFNDPGFDPQLPTKNLVGFPWRVALALQKDGWILRQDIIWHKPNPMPESVQDRCTKSHEYLFLLAKKPKYFFDPMAMKEPAKCGAKGSHFHTGKTGIHQLGRSSKKPRGPGNKNHGKHEAGVATEEHRTKGGLVDYAARVRENIDIMEMRHKRSVWSVTTKPFKEAHFATFPPDLIEPCLLAGTRPDDTVLDPFFGAGTVGLVAIRHNRKWIGIELNEEYVRLAEKRLGLVVA